METSVQVDGWLHKRPCKDCTAKIGIMSELVLDVSTLLNLKGKQDVGYYCNCGPTGHKMEDEPAWKQQWTCDMVLCIPCYDKRKTNMGNGKRTRQRRQLS